jgi:hypothetical protein
MEASSNKIKREITRETFEHLDPLERLFVESILIKNREWRIIEKATNQGNKECGGN